jgi:hypothetical protein
MEILEMAILARFLSLEMLEFLPSKASSFLPIFAPLLMLLPYTTQTSPGVRSQGTAFFFLYTFKFDLAARSVGSK